LNKILQYRTAKEAFQKNYNYIQAKENQLFKNIGKSKNKVANLNLKFKTLPFYKLEQC